MKELILKRTYAPKGFTMGELTGFSQLIYTLEDEDRGLVDNMPLEQIQTIKVKSKTAIPMGRYIVILTFSNRFQCMMPLLVNVKGFEGIRIHKGNYAESTDGCLLVGLTKSINDKMIGRSKDAYEKIVLPELTEMLKESEVFITITY